jgi:hypothetical protein
LLSLNSQGGGIPAGRIKKDRKKRKKLPVGK